MRARTYKWTAFALLLITVSVIIFTAFRLTGSSHSQADGTMDFTFTWGPEAQNIVDGTFKIEVSVWFENRTPFWSNTTINWFYMNVSVYDDDYSPNDYLGFVFDMNHNGIIDFGMDDEPFIFYPNNTTISHSATILHKDSSIIVPEIPRLPALNKCRYETENGYVFGPFGYATSDISSKIVGGCTYIPIHMCFEDANLPVTTHRRSTIASVQFIVYLVSE